MDTETLPKIHTGDDEFNFDDDEYAEVLDDIKDAVDRPHHTIKNKWIYAVFFPDREYHYDENGRQWNNGRWHARVVNKWCKNYDIEELQALCSSASQYRKYFNLDTEKVVDFLRATKMVLNIQGGMDRFESYLDVFWDKENVQAYEKSKSEGNKKRIMMAVAAYMNSKLLLKMAKALDAPIQINYQGYKHQMIEVLRDIAVNGKSQRERVNAADKLLIHLNPNQLASLNLVNINLDGIQGSNKSIIDSYREGIEALAKEKLKLIKQGVDSNDVINAEILSEVKNG